MSRTENIAAEVHDEFAARGWLSDPDDGDISADRDLEFFAEVERRSRIRIAPAPERPPADA